MKKILILSLSIVTAFTTTACQQERISLNEATEEIEEVFNVTPAQEEDTEQGESTNTTQKTQLTKIEETTKILDLAAEDYYFKFEYSPKLGTLEIEQIEEAENMASSSYKVKKAETDLAQIDIYNDEALEIAYNELDDFDSFYDTDDHSFTVNTLTEDEEVLNAIMQSFYAEDL